MQSTKYTLGTFSKQFLVLDGAKCYRHCEKPTRFVSLLDSDDKLVGAYVCPEEFVSRVVFFSKAPEMSWFESFLRDQVGERLRAKDLRRASRHGWELGRDAEKSIVEVVEPSKGLSEAYWTFYAMNEEDKKSGTFLCSTKDGGCGKRMFTKRMDDHETKLCANCRSSGRKQPPQGS